jgi:hypothetical protein
MKGEGAGGGKEVTLFTGLGGLVLKSRPDWAPKIHTLLNCALPPVQKSNAGISILHKNIGAESFISIKNKKSRKRYIPAFL